MNMSNLFHKEIDPSKVNRMKWEAEIERTGDRDLLCFGTADMDFPSAKPILDAIHKVADAGHLGYPFVQPGFYDAIINWQKRLGRWEIKPEWIATHVGVYPSSWAIIEALTEPGDEIIFQTPVHFCFDAVTRDNGRVPIYNPLVQRNGHFEMDYEHFEAAITPRTKIMWLCNPHNPVGRAWSREELEKLGEICLKNNIIIMSDDVYCGLLYPGKTYTPIASLSKELSMNTITCYSTSKIYNTTGVKQSFVVCENPELLEAYNLSLRKQNLNYGKNVFGLAVTEAAFNHCDDWVRELMDYVSENHNTTKKLLEDGIPGVVVGDAEATYFVWIDFRVLGLDRTAMENLFEKKARVIVEVGHKFGDVGEGFVRLNLACRREVLIEGMERIIKAVKN